jgi:hypothetical protein
MSRNALRSPTSGLRSRGSHPGPWWSFAGAFEIEIRDVSSVLAMEQIKYTTEMPLDYMMVEKESGSHAA